MSTSPYKTWLAVALLVLMPCMAHAVGLGRLTVLSTLGQPLSAEIDLVSVGKDEIGTLTPRLAPAEAFTEAKLTFSPSLVGARVTVERRTDGMPYIKIVSARPVNDPFVELMIEVTWAQGKLTREYTALIDPAEFIAAASAASTTVVSPAAVTAEPIAPAVSTRSRGAAKRADGLVSSTSRSGNQYGPVKRGETLVGIAGGTRPEGVTLEQMLVSLYRSNPEAFTGNMNRLRAGAILRVPDKEQITELSPESAVREVRVQAANWNAYRQQVAGMAPDASVPDSGSRAGGRISTRVDDKARLESGDVLRLSKGDVPGAGKAGGSKLKSRAARSRTLEEETIAREKALADANERIVQLEKTLKDMQTKVELKGQPPLKGSAPAPTAISPAPTPQQAAPADTSQTPPAAIELRATPAPAATPPGVQPAEPAAAASPAPKPKIVEAPPAPAPDLVDEILGEPLYLAAIALVLLGLGGAGYVLSRRRRKSESLKDLLGQKTAPKLGKGSADAAAHPASSGKASEDADPLAEADLYLNFGRDAQAEEVLKEVLVKNPTNEEAQLKLLRIYAGRKEKAAFEKTAKILYGQTKGAGDNWLKAAGLGYAFDAANPLYEAGKSAPPPAAAAPQPATTDLDFDLELAPSAEAPPAGQAFTPAETRAPQAGIPRTEPLAAAASQENLMSSRDLSPAIGTASSSAATVMPDFSLPATAATTVDTAAITTAVEEPVTASIGNALDFNLDTTEPAARVAQTKTPASTAPTIPESSSQAEGLSIDFELPDFNQMSRAAGSDPSSASDAAKETKSTQPGAAFEFKLDDIDLDLDGPNAATPQAAEGAVKDDHWYDVQTKFDLAKAYQEMGDKHGMREILEEVVKEGDTGQQEEAKKLLATLT